MGISVCRNPKLADVFYRLELIEAYGTGIQKILNGYQGTGKTPRIETSDNAFKIILPNLYSPELNNSDAGSGGSNSVKHVRFERGTSESSSEAEQIIALALKQGAVTRKDVERLLGISQTTSGRVIRQMVENGQIVRKGRWKNTRYFLSD